MGRSLQHRLPAAIVGGFSNSTTPASRRDRSVWVRRRGSTGLQRVRAGTVGGSYDVYTLIGRPFKGSELDDVWAYFEASIPSLIDRLSSPNRPIGLIDRSSFLTVLVPYVSAALVRGDDYDDRFKAFMTHLSGQFPDNTNINRTIDFDLLCGRLLRCSWIFCTAPAGERFLINDLGWSPMVVAPGDARIFLPLSPAVALMVGRVDPSVWTRVPGGATLQPGFWSISADQVGRVNQSAVDFCYRDVYSGSRFELEGLELPNRRSEELPEPREVITRFPEDEMRPADTDWRDELVRADLPTPQLPVINLAIPPPVNLPREPTDSAPES